MLRQPSLRPRHDQPWTRVFRSLAPLRHNKRFWKWGSAVASGLMILTLFVTIAPRVLFVQAAGASYCPTSAGLSDCITTTSGSGLFLSTTGPDTGTLFARQGAILTVIAGFASSSDKVNCFALSGTSTTISAPNPQHTSGKSQASGNFTATAGSGDGSQTITATGFNDQGHTNCSTVVATSGSTSAHYTLDNTGPTVTPSVSPAPNGAGWNKANVTVTLASADPKASDGSDGSGVKNVTYTINGGTQQTYSAPFALSTEGVDTIAYTATDNVGNVTTGSLTIKLDKTNPTVSGSAAPPANGNGWNNTPVVVTFTCSDPNNSSNNTPGSGIATCDGVNGTTGATSVTTQAASQSATGTATDTASNSASATVSNINIDETPPSLSGAPATSPTGTDASSVSWYNTPVTIQWTCSDALSGINGSCPANSVISGEGRNQTASATVSDKASNPTTATSNPAVNIDLTPPTTTVSGAPVDWTNNTVTLTFTASDNLSGVAATNYVVDGNPMGTGSSVTISAEGTHTVQYWSQDYAGNFENTHTATIRIDKTAPVISHSLAPAPNGAGWNKSNVTVTFSCSDPTNANGTTGSGVNTCDGATGTTGSTADSTEGATSVTGAAVDNAGNSASDTATVNLDKTPPTVVGSADRPANPHGWYNAPVTVTFSCSDPTNASNNTPGSGIATNGCTPPATLSGDGANQHANGAATDVAGNSASTSVTGINIDQTPPTLSGAPTSSPNGAGWYNAPVAIHWACADALSGIDGSCPANTTISGEGTGLTSSATVSDKASNTTTATSSPAVNIDTTAPVTTVVHQTSAAYIDNGGDLWYAGDVSLDLSATDNLSGPAVTYITVDGSPAVPATSVTVSGAGHHTVTFWSVDNAGNVEDKTAAGHSVFFTIDTTPPTIGGAPDRDPNANNWYNAPVTVTFTCADHESGLASCTSPITLANDGFNQQASGVAVDNVGNTANASVGSINIDQTKPTLTGAATTSPNTNGWYNANVTVAWTASDTLSGIDPATAPANSVITGEGTGLTASASVSDLASNSTSASSAPVNIDRTGPHLTGAVTTASSGTDASSNIWYNTNVNIHWSCDDPKLADGSAGSGMATCPADSAVSGEGVGLSISATATDKADNATTAPSPSVNIDRTPPNTMVIAPSGWSNTDVTVDFSAADNLSGVKATYYSLDGAADQAGTSLTLSAEGDHTIAFYSVDYASNKETAKTVHVKIDKTAPNISDTHSPVPNIHGWNKTDVTVTFTCSDPNNANGTPGSGINTCDGVVGTTGSTTVTTEGKDQAVPGTAVDNAGNTATDPAMVSIDKTNPTISGKTDRDPNASGWYNAPVTVTFTCDDPSPSVGVTPSGVASCPMPVTLGTDGRNLSASGAVVDNAGNNASTSVGGVNLDQQAPTITGAPTTTANPAGWYNGDVTIHWTCTDPKLADGSDGSGVATSACPADSVIQGEGANLGASVSASDLAGNTGYGSVSGIQIDRTPPVTTASAPAASYTDVGGHAYYAGTVQVILTATDTLSGPAHTYFTLDGGSPQTYSVLVAISIEGEHTLTFWSVDNAGNVEDQTAPGHSLTFRIDNTGPTVNTTRTPANANHWNNGPVTVTFSCVDPTLAGGSVPGSGVGGCDTSVTLTGEGGNQSVTGNGVDNVGNTSSATVSNINIDKTPPTLSGAPVAVANGFGWYNGDVAIHWTSGDALSGIDPSTAPPDSVISGEGAGLTAHASVSDLAGNATSANSAPVNIDRTAPDLTSAITSTGSLDAHGVTWYSGPVAVAWKACDTLSGVDPASMNSSSVLSGNCYTWTDTVSGEGANQTSAETVADKAGNPASNAVNGINIDTTPPTTTVSGAPADWTNKTVTLTLNATDNLSGVANTYYTVDGSSMQTGTSITLTGDGVHTIGYWSSDYAGNTETTHTVMVKIDNTAPTISHQQAPAANSNNWNNSDVTVSFTCADALSGIASCDGVSGGAGSTTVSIEGVNQAVTGTAVDNAGNTRSDTATVSVDKTRPVITGAPDRAANAARWYNAAVTVTFSCNDPNGANGTPGSGIASCPTPTTLGEGANQSVSGSASDFAGNSASATVSDINIDETAPVVSGAPTTSPNSAGWYKGDVTIHWTCSDPKLAGGAQGSGVAICQPDSVINGEGSNLTASGSATDVAGNPGSGSVSGINIDRHLPSLTVTAGGTSFTDGSGANTGPTSFSHTITTPYMLGGAPTFTCSATDATSGFGSGPVCSGSVSGGTTGGVGAFTYTATSTDLAGNTVKVTVSYQVIYGFSGFLQPVNYTAHQIGASSSQFKGGATIPVKFQLRLANGTVVQAPAAPLWVDPLNAGPTTSDPSASAASAPATTSNGGVFSWDASGQQYIYTWHTASTQTGNWWRIGVKLNDGQIYFVYIALR